MKTSMVGPHHRRMSAWLWLLLALVLLPMSTLWAQNVGDSFDPGANGAVATLAQQADGKLLVAGAFSYIGGGQGIGLARLTADGQIDPGFIADINGPVTSIMPLNDGRILIGGFFNRVDGITRTYVGLLKADGALDPSFDLQIGYSDMIGGFARQPDGKILIGGAFQFVQGTPAMGLTRLNADGTVDPGFAPFYVADGWFAMVTSVAVEADGKIVVAGDFEPADGSQPWAVMRLNADGSQDSSYLQLSADEMYGLNMGIQRLAVLGDGSIIGAGSLAMPASSGQQAGVVRLHADGSVDTSFHPIPNGGVADMQALPDGRIVIAGTFTAIDGTPAKRIARLRRDGSLDASFTTSADANVNAIVLQDDGKIAVGGTFTQIGGLARARIARLETDGSIETSFLAGADPIYPGTNRGPRCLVQQPDRKWLVGCSINYVGSMPMTLARLQPDGSIDAGFMAPDFTNSADVVALQPDGKILIGGKFATVNGQTRPGIARLNTDGSLDASFVPANWTSGGPSPWARQIAVQPDGKILLAGWYAGANNNIPVVTRFNADGSLDNSFVSPTIDSTVDPMVLQSDGKILIAGFFSTVNGVPRNHVARLNADGSLDTTFQQATDAGFGAVQAVQLQPDGKVLIAGGFTIAGNSPGIARLNADGSLDGSFAAPPLDGQVMTLAMQSDGSITIGGIFTHVNGLRHRFIARLDASGALDSGFDAAVDGMVTALAQQADGKLLVGGDFTQVNGQARSYIARLPATLSATQTLSVAPAGGVSWMTGGAWPAMDYVRFDVSLDGTTWSPLGTGTNVTGGWQLDAATLPRDVDIWVRAQGVAAGGEGGTGNASGSVFESVRLSHLLTMYTVTPQAGVGGALNPGVPVLVSAGNSAAFTVAADPGYAIDSVTGCGGTLTGTVYTAAPVSADCTVTATFIQSDRIFANGFE